MSFYVMQLKRGDPQVVCHASSESEAFEMVVTNLRVQHCDPAEERAARLAFSDAFAGAHNNARCLQKFHPIKFKAFGRNFFVQVA